MLQFALLIRNQMRSFITTLVVTSLPRGFGRARNKYTDPDLALQTKAVFDDHGDLQNVEEIAAELDSKSQSTHGYGPLVFSVSKTINFIKAKSYADDMIQKGHFPYNGLYQICEQLRTLRY